ncbi:THAP-type domain-containing protein [Aphis craccivora]|uniref:THAP-type domain-containing protein n=1 Tax=Aphis craccivora TaxID=307492 RepID=A0A6G0ZMH2_APHCR|nr:THAP-type domain-containing protein [Aphis craccivora]
MSCLFKLHQKSESVGSIAFIYLFQSIHKLTKFKLKKFNNTTRSADQFVNYINELENIFISEFPIISVKNNVGKELRNVVNNVPFDRPCSEFDTDFLKNLYIRMRIFHALKTLNKNVLFAPRRHR